jgi:hypothetical protein
MNDTRPTTITTLPGQGPSSKYSQEYELAPSQKHDASESGQGISLEEIAVQVLKENAHHLYFKTTLCDPKGGTIPLTRGDTTYTMICAIPYKQEHRRSIALRIPGDFNSEETLDLTDQEIDYLHNYAYQQVIQHYAGDRSVIGQAQGTAPTTIESPQKHHAVQAMQARLTLDQEEEIKSLRAENCQLREAKDDLETRITSSEDQKHDASLIQEKDNRIAELETRLQHSEDQRMQQYMNYSHLLDWIKNILPNTTIPSGCKVTYIFLFFLFHSMRHQIVEEELHVPIAAIADGTGQSTSAVHDHLAKAAAHDLLTRDDIKEQVGEDEKRTIVHLTLHQPILEPEHIDLQKKQGGKRQKGCKIDGTPLDRYTVTHCPTHGEIGLYGQPGTPKDADENIMIDDFIRKYENRVPRALAKRRDPVTGRFASQDQNQDAFNHQETNLCQSNDQKSLSPASTRTLLNASSITPLDGSVITLSAPLPLMERTTKPDVQDTEQLSTTQVPDGKKSLPTNTFNKKQDAFEQPATSSLSLSPENSLLSSLNEAQSLFWKQQWCPISGTDPKSMNETSYRHVCWFAERGLTTTDIQSLRDYACDRLRELCQTTGKPFVPPRLGNLVKVYPEWDQTRIQRDREQEQGQKRRRHLPETGRLPSFTEKWKQERLAGIEQPPETYQRLPDPARKTSKGNNLDFSGTLELSHARKRTRH